MPGTSFEHRFRWWSLIFTRFLLEVWYICINVNPKAPPGQRAPAGRHCYT
jgi:hypothetical protein